MSLVRQELLGTRVFVFTRNGRILNLARGATLADAAKHQSIALSSCTPILNGKASQASQELSNGDIVDFERSSVRLIDRLAAGRIDSDDTSTTGVTGVVGGEEVSRVNAADVSNGVTKRLFSDRWAAKRKRINGLDEDGADTEESTAATAAEMAAATGATDANGVEGGLDPQILRMGLKQRAKEYLRSRQTSTTTTGAASSTEAEELTASLEVFCTDRKGMLVDVASVVTEGVINVLGVHSEIFEAGGKSVFKYEVVVKDRSQLEKLLEELRSVPDVTRVDET